MAGEVTTAARSAKQISPAHTTRGREKTQYRHPNKHLAAAEDQLPFASERIAAQLRPSENPFSGVKWAASNPGGDSAAHTPHHHFKRGAWSSCADVAMGGHFSRHRRTAGKTAQARHRRKHQRDRATDAGGDASVKQKRQYAAERSPGPHPSTKPNTTGHRLEQRQ